ncbi:MAG: tetratricopeptide repeat protein [Treponema sp.]|nr:tetratricopeptide repeat protein [Treponema sp.]
MAKTRNVCFSLILAFHLLTFFSCMSSGFRVPGEKAIIFKNIATEYYSIAEGYMDIKKYDKAAEYYTLAMRNKELYLTSYYKLARAYALAKNWDKAFECYSDLLSLDKDNSVLKASLAYITAMRGETDNAILQYKDLITENPYDENLLESYVALLLNVGRSEDAESSFFILKEKFPDNKQLSNFAQQLADTIDNFDADKKISVSGESKAEKGDSNQKAS